MKFVFLTITALIGLVLLSSCVGPFVSLEGDPPVVNLNNQGQFFTNFSRYRGTRETLPLGMFVTGEDGSGRIAGGSPFNPFTGVHRFQRAQQPASSFEGFGAFHKKDGAYSFGFREFGDTDLRNSRLFLRYRNPTDTAIIGFIVRFDVEAWVVGERDNRIRLKYNTSQTGFAEISNLVSVVNPRADLILTSSGSLPIYLDGTADKNRTRVTTQFLLENEHNENGPFSPLQPGELAYFRWQYSNANFEQGEKRSALGITNISIHPVFEE